MKETREHGASDPESTHNNTSFAHQHGDEEDVEIPELSIPMTLGLLVVVTVLVGVTAECLVDSINGLSIGGGISKEFIGLILLPIVGNAAEHEIGRAHV